MNPSLLAASYFLHLLATVVWLGGMALLVLLIYPLQSRHPSREVREMLTALSRRFRPYANFSLWVLLVTGVVQTSEDEHYGGLLDFSTPWSQAILAKHIAFIGMALIIAWLQFGLAPALERAHLLQKADSLETLGARERRLIQVNFGLGLIVLFFTAIATAQ